MAQIRTIRIHPAIGIARVGNSPDEFFIGPELPGDRSVPAGGYKDRQYRVKRQAARFRLFGYDAHGVLVKELDATDATITWTVHLANKKAAWHQFRGLSTGTPLRAKTRRAGATCPALVSGATRSGKTTATTTGARARAARTSSSSSRSCCATISSVA